MGPETLGLLRRLALPDRTPDEARRQIASLGQRAIELEHPSVLRVREVIEQGELLALFYEHAEAEPLRSLQSWANLRGLSFPIGVALRIMVDFLHGLAGGCTSSQQRVLGASACGGLSPDSVLIARDGATRLCDPLIASGAALLEGIGFNTAKLAYAAPEQVHAAASPTSQTDLFTCAAMLWELLASRRLLAGSRPAIERKLLEHNLPDLRASLRAPQQVSDELVALVELTLSARSRERPRSASELAATPRRVWSRARFADGCGGVHRQTLGAALRSADGGHPLALVGGPGAGRFEAAARARQERQRASRDHRAQQ